MMQKHSASSRCEAIKNGFSRYFTGKPCPKGHVDERTIQGTCVACKKAHEKHRWQINPDGSRNRLKALKEKDPYAFSKSKSLSARKWEKKYPEKLAANKVARDRAEKRAVVSWSNKTKMHEIYAMRDALNAAAGEWHVDHIVPLNSKIVCGLHNEFNLAVITASENHKKNNKHWPDMPGFPC